MFMELLDLHADILVIGGGLAGLSAALQARQAGCKVIVAAKGKIGRSGNTIMARNSIAAVLDNKGNKDSIARHIKDTMDGGDYLNDEKLVAVLAGGAPEAVNWLMQHRVPFLCEEGHVIVKGSPGHSDKRVLTVDGSAFKSQKTPGLAITGPLTQEAKKQGIEILESVLITSLLNKGGEIKGACGFDRRRERAFTIKSRGVILACGGAGSLYPFTTNTADVTGDGYALASEAGAKLKDLEFIQFHPCVTIDSPRLVLSTAPFSDGAILTNNSGEQYMYQYSVQGNMATRDVMAQASFSEINAGRGTGRKAVFMDFGGVKPGFMASKYADIKDYLQGKLKVEVAPAAHFEMGGVIIDNRCRTTLPGLYACGEVAGGVHGANRLAANALTEAVVFGLRAGKHAAAEVLRHCPVKYDKNQSEQLQCKKQNFSEFLPTHHESNAFRLIMQELRRLMGRHVSVVRYKDGHQKDFNGITIMQERINQTEPHDYRQLLDYHQVKLMLISGYLISQAALQREESKGAHYRADSIMNSEY